MVKVKNNMVNGKGGSKRRLYLPRATKTLSINKSKAPRSELMDELN